jgi:hypothetical protein
MSIQVVVSITQALNAHNHHRSLQDVVLALTSNKHRPTPLNPLRPPARPLPLHLHTPRASNGVQCRLLMDTPQPRSCAALPDVHPAHTRKVQRP